MRDNSRAGTQQCILLGWRPATGQSLQFNWLDLNTFRQLNSYFLLYTSQKNGTINENQPAKEVMVTDGR